MRTHAALDRDLPHPAGGFARTTPALAALLLLVGCAGRTPPVAPESPLPPNPAASQDGGEEAPLPEGQDETAEDGGEGKSEWVAVRPTTVVIESGEAPREPTLVEASAAAKRKRKDAPPPIAVINDDNLAEYARRGRVTFAEPGPQPAAPEEEGVAAAVEAEAQAPGAGGEAAPPLESQGESYWRQGVLERRRRWQQAVESVEDLQEQTEGLRRQFYREDDPYVRDSRIKPAWDRALDRLAEVRLEVEAHRRELNAFIEEGRRSGALPGWLREGLDLEPQPEPESGDLPVLEPREPDVKEPGGPGR